MKRQATVAGKHVLIEVNETSAGTWMASSEIEGQTISVSGPTANRAASDLAVAVSRSQHQ